MYVTFRSVFPHLYVFPVGDGNLASLRNIILVGSATQDLSRGEILALAAEAARSRRITVPTIVQDAGDLLQASIATDDVPLLTDDYAPTDALIPSSR
jgi:hypothetical protein